MDSTIITALVQHTKYLHVLRQSHADDIRIPSDIVHLLLYKGPGHAGRDYVCNWGITASDLSFTCT